LPGANSLIPSLIASGLNIENFYYFGWLSPKKEIRKHELRKLKNIRELIIIMETPYRLSRLLTDIIVNFGKEKHIVLAYKLTMPEEKILRDSVQNILKIVDNEQLKGEFVLLINNR
jgi:16S rRNA (cytidine1402-2'-O)-methyltransferase